MKGRIRLAAIAAATILVLIVILQNTETVETKLLFISISMPRAGLLFGTTAVGFVLGVLLGNRLTRGKKNSG